MLTFLVSVVIFFIATILYFREVYARLDKYGIKYLKPIPLLGNMLDVVTRKQHMVMKIQELYNTYPGERFTGMYDSLNATIHINDPELIKMITVKDFEHFIDRRALVDGQTDAYFGRILFAMKGREWKDMRCTLSPAFTSSKIKAMVPFMVEVHEQMIRMLKKAIQESEAGYVDVDCKDLTSRYANDVIASCAFGMKLDSHTEKNNDFYKMGKKATMMDYRVILVILGYFAVPELMKIMNIKILADKVSAFFKRLVMNNMKEREEHNIVRPDMIHLLMEAKKGKLRHEEKDTPDAGYATVEESEFGTKTVNREWSDSDLVAQAVQFVFAGFETSSSVMTFVLYELARHPEVQDRLLQEIREHEAKNGGKLDFDSVQKLRYLDMVISEVLRLWPPVFGLIRECAKDYNIGRANDKATRDYIVRKGQGITIPVWSIHRDAKYFPDPEKFDPERFSNENKGNIKHFSYMPFGTGPRNCIGSRFALCEVKVMAYQMIQQLELSLCEKSTVPPQLDHSTFNIMLRGGCWLRIKSRKLINDLI